MADYAYKKVRDLLPAHIIEAQGPDYGDQWYAAEAYILELIAERDELREKYTDTYGALDDAARENTSLRAQLAEIAATEHDRR